MELMNLLDEAKSAGLEIEVKGDQVIVRGPREAEPIVNKLRPHKAAIIRQFSTDWHSDGHRVISQLPDNSLRKVLSESFDSAIAADISRGLSKQEACQNSFGLLMFWIIKSGVDITARTEQVVNKAA